MEQLEMRFYNLDELAEITGVKRQANNFKRDVENTLTKWGYCYDWFNRRGATITCIPSMPEERLQEILVRQFHVDIQVDMFAFACFITAFSDVPGYDSMPWGERAPILYKHYGICIDERTLRNWCKKLLDQEIISINSNGSFWKTEILDNRKIRSPATEEEVQQYYKRRSELLEELSAEYRHVKPKASDSEARRVAWESVYQYLWAEYHCCFYSCKSFNFQSWNTQGEIYEIIELAKEITERRRSCG